MCDVSMPSMPKIAPTPEAEKRPQTSEVSAEERRRLYATYGIQSTKTAGVQGVLSNASVLNGKKLLGE